MSGTPVEPVEHIRAGKAQVFLRPEANALLRAAIAVYGRPIFPTGSGSAGRTYAQQDFFWQRFQRNGSPVASRPDRGPRPHMRFGAIDISDYGARTAMLQAGWLATTPSEWWHFEHPDCRSWPIVTDPQLSPPTTEEDPMKIIAPFGGDAKAVIGPGIGHVFTTWDAYVLFCNVWGFDPNAAQVIGDPSVGKDTARRWFDQTVALHRPPTPASVKTAPIVEAVRAAIAATPAGNTVDVDAIAAAVEARLQDDFAGIPAATRAAIVK